MYVYACELFAPQSYTCKSFLLSLLPQFVPNDDFNQILLKCVQEISQHLRVALAPPNNPHIGMMRSLLEITMQLRIAQNYTNVVMLLQKVHLILLE